MDDTNIPHLSSWVERHVSLLNFFHCQPCWTKLTKVMHIPVKMAASFTQSPDSIKKNEDAFSATWCWQERYPW